MQDLLNASFREQTPEMKMKMMKGHCVLALGVVSFLSGKGGEY